MTVKQIGRKRELEFRHQNSEIGSLLNSLRFELSDYFLVVDTSHWFRKCDINLLGWPTLILYERVSQVSLCLFLLMSLHMCFVLRLGLLVVVNKVVITLDDVLNNWKERNHFYLLNFDSGFRLLHLKVLFSGRRWYWWLVPFLDIRLADVLCSNLVITP